MPNGRYVIERWDDISYELGAIAPAIMPTELLDLGTEPVPDDILEGEDLTEEELDDDVVAG